MRFIVLGHHSRPRKGETGQIEYFGPSKAEAREVMDASPSAVVELVTISRFGLLKHKTGVVEVKGSDGSDGSPEAAAEAAKAAAEAAKAAAEAAKAAAEAAKAEKEAAKAEKEAAKAAKN